LKYFIYIPALSLAHFFVFYFPVSLVVRKSNSFKFPRGRVNNNINNCHRLLIMNDQCGDFTRFLLTAFKRRYYIQLKVCLYISVNISMIIEESAQ